MRKIIHIDMDAFYGSARVARLSRQIRRSSDLWVGGKPPRRVVKAASYEARPGGVHSAMSSAEAKRRCPELIFVSPRMDVYRAVSKRIRALLSRYTDLIEPASLDEATNLA